MMAALAFEPNGKTMISVDLDGDFHVWDLATLKKKVSTEVELAFPTMAQAAALSPDGKTLVIGTGNSDVFALPQEDYGTIRLFDVATGRERLAPEKETQRTKDEAAEAARLADAAKAQARREQEHRLAMAKLDPALRAKLDRASATAPRLLYALHLNQAQQAIERGRFGAAKKLLEEHLPRAGQEDLRGFEWHHLWRRCPLQITKLEQREALCGSWHGAGPRLSTDGKMLAVADIEHGVTLWNLTTGKERATLTGVSGPVWQLRFSSDGKYLVTAGGSTLPPTEEKDDPSSREAVLWDVQSGKALAKLEGSKKAIGCVAFSADGKSLAIGDQDGTVRVFDVRSGKLAKSLPLGFDHACALVFSPDGKALTVGGASGDIAMWSLTDGKKQTLSGGQANMPILSLQFNPDGKVLYSTSGDWSADRCRQALEPGGKRPMDCRAALETRSSAGPRAGRQATRAERLARCRALGCR